MIAQITGGDFVGFSPIFKRLCTEKGVTQKKALADMGLGRNAAQAWNDGDPSTPTAKKLAEYFGVSIDVILQSDGGAPSNSFNDANNSVVVQGSEGATVTTGAQQKEDGLTEQERELLKVFRSFDQRKKTKVMNFIFDMEDGTVE